MVHDNKELEHFLDWIPVKKFDSGTSSLKAIRRNHVTQSKGSPGGKKCAGWFHQYPQDSQSTLLHTTSSVKTIRLLLILVGGRTCYPGAAAVSIENL